MSVKGSREVVMYTNMNTHPHGYQCIYIICAAADQHNGNDRTVYCCWGQCNNVLVLLLLLLLFMLSTGLWVWATLHTHTFTSFALSKIETRLPGVKRRPIDLWKAELSLYNRGFQAFTKLALRKSYVLSKFLPQNANSPWLIFLHHNHRPWRPQLPYAANTCPAVLTSGSK